jgi:DNA-binding response OmpR family regulator
MLRIMAEEPEKNQSSSVPIASMLKRGEVTILVVEDDKFLRELLTNKIKKEGFSVVEAIDGENGLAMVAEKNPQLIVLDLLLPGIGGFEVMEKLRADSKTEKIPVIVLSNLGAQEDMDRAYSLGAKQFMIKAHHTPQEIVNQIKKVLDESYLKR